MKEHLERRQIKPLSNGDLRVTLQSGVTIYEYSYVQHHLTTMRVKNYLDSGGLTRKDSIAIRKYYGK